MSWTLPALLAGVLIVVLLSPLSRTPMSSTIMIKQTVDTIRLKSLRPEGTISEDDFVFGTEELNQELQAGEVLFKLLAISADPFQRGRMKSAEGKYDEIMSGFVAGQVVESSNAQFPQGALIAGYRPYRTFQILKSSEMSAFWDLTAFISPEEISLGVGVLGMPGATAYHGLLNILKPKKGETIFISAASGAVGALVGQIASKVVGCIVVGSCGGAKKNAHILELGFHHAVDYKALDGSKEALVNKIKEFAPNGIDMDFENVGGVHFDACFSLLKLRGRIAICGAISNYNKAGTGLGGHSNPLDIGSMIYSRQKVEGFLASDELAVEERNFIPYLSKLVKDKTLICEETFFEGFKSWPAAFVSVMTGTHLGKVVVRIK